MDAEFNKNAFLLIDKMMDRDRRGKFENSNGSLKKFKWCYIKTINGKIRMNKRGRKK
jgi:hypothetical protein